MSKLEIIFAIFILIFLPSLINSQEPEPLYINSTLNLNVTTQGKLYNLIIKPEDIGENKYLSISTKPKDYQKPAFIYLYKEKDKPASPDYRNFSSQEIGTNILYIYHEDLNLDEEEMLSVFIGCLSETEIELKVDVGTQVVLQDYPKGFRHKYNLLMTSGESASVLFEMTKYYDATKKVLFYALGEKIDYFDFTVELVGDSGKKQSFEVKQMFENGYGAAVDITRELFDGDDHPRIRVTAKTSHDEYLYRKVELGYDIIDNINNSTDIRNVELLEHVYGSALNETCYKIEDLQNKPATMLINTFTQSVMFNIKKDKDIVYSVDVFNNYFIRLPKEFYETGNYFCFKHINPKTSDEETYGEVSYDFQIYYEDELADYQMFIMPLISGKIYTHSLNRGDIMIYRNSFYDGLDEKKIYSANMLSIRGNPKLYGYTCNEYPNCNITSDDLKDSTKVEKTFPLNMYHINKRLNAEGNIEIDSKGDAVYELRKQYMTIVSCESDETDPNNGECKYTIEINNEGNTIQLTPETVFSTSIVSGNNYFMISLKDYQTLNYLKIHFTVLTGNAELSIYTDSKHETKFLDYNFNHIHRKEIFEINKDLKEYYYLVITCQEPSFIQLKYETNEHYKGYDNLMPNELNIEPINKNSKAYYNMFNPNYYFPFDDEERNNDFYFKIIPIDCSMDCSDVSHNYYDLKAFDFLSEKNKLYQYLSTYGFIGQAHKFEHTSSEEEKCGIIIYNGEISLNRPLLVSSDMPLNSTFDNTYYTYPIIFDENKDNGIIIEFKIYNKEGSTEKDLYTIEILINGNKYDTDVKTIDKDQAIYIPKSAYENYFKDNKIGNLNINILKQYTNRNYSITTNFIGAKVSPEYIYTNKDYEFNLRPKSFKYFYSQISKDSEGQIKFKNIPKDIELYAKIVKKNKIEDQHDWNGRVKLPTSGDSDLIEVKNGRIDYDKSMTQDCEEGCEIYIGVDSSKVQTEEALIPLTFSFTHSIYKDYLDTLDYEETITVQKDKMVYYKINYTNTTSEGDIVVITTTPKKYTQPGYIYISNEDKPSIDNYNYISQTPGTNQIIINKKYFLDNEMIYLGIKPFADTEIKFKMSLEKEISLEDFTNTRAKLKFSDGYTISFKKTGKLNQDEILIYSLAENYNYFSMIVEYTPKEGQTHNIEVKQIFENGYGAFIDFDSEIFKDDKNPKLKIIIKQSEDKYKDRKVEVGYEFVDNIETNEDKREVEIWEHVYGMATNETCYKVKDIQNKSATMLINTFSQSALINIRDENHSIVYSLDLFNNYFFRLPKEFYDPNSYFCFKHITPKTSEEEIIGEVSYDFQIYYEDELANYQMFIMPLINGKIYTHSLNRGDIMIYRNNFYGNYTEGSEKKIYSVNMLRIRGSPKLYGYTCNDYPNCIITPDDLKDTTKVEKIFPLNMYHINKRLNAEGNTEIDSKGDAVYELRKQYMTIVSCESEETDPNNGECKYTIEINNEMDEIQLIPETVFTTSIVNPINYFLIRLKDYKETNYLKIHFTVLTGNAELYIYDDWFCTHEIEGYDFKHIHRKEIIEINKEIKENYYLIVKCSEPSFIQLKYETNAHYKGYDVLIPNEVNLVPINNNTQAYYNLYNPNYYFPFKDINNDFYYKITTMDCSMNWRYIDTTVSNLTHYEFEQKKNILYSYLSTYGFTSQINQYTHTPSENEYCGLIIYNGEEAKDKPLLITSDMPHKSNFVDTYYVYPIIYDENKDEGIIIEFKAYGYTSDLNDTVKYKITYRIEGAEENTIELVKQNIVYIDKKDYGEILKNNIIGNLYITLNKQHSDKDYYVTTNVIGSKISPEFFYPNEDYEFKLRKSSSKYFYTPINNDSDGYIQFNGLNNKIKVYAKIVRKNDVEDGYNWNKRVKLPEANDPKLLDIDDGVVAYYKNQTDKCTSGCELYFQIKSEDTKLQNSLKIFSEDLITISFTFKEEKYEKGGSDEPSDSDTDHGDDSGGKTQTWKIVVGVVVPVVVIIAVVIIIVVVRKKRVSSGDINKRDINELSMPLE